MIGESITYIAYCKVIYLQADREAKCRAKTILFSWIYSVADLRRIRGTINKKVWPYAYIIAVSPIGFS